MFFINDTKQLLMNYNNKFNLSDHIYLQKICLEKDR